tara:strand:- start:731 stop:1060 length:330 start_codon:yes stop_codon:yes gene_type:complete
MAHFAELNNSNIVLRVTVVDDIHEANGEAWCNNFWGGNWKQTSYNGSIRKQFAGQGMTYDTIKDKFIKPQPFPSWALDINDDWQPPTPMPEGGVMHNWDEPTLTWKVIV